MLLQIILGNFECLVDRQSGRIFIRASARGGKNQREDHSQRNETEILHE